MFPVLVPSCSFSIEHYQDILYRACQLGYHFYTHYEYGVLGKCVEPFILLRHDIDFSLKYALPLIKIEKSMGIRSSIFVRVHSSGYNPFDIDNYAILEELHRTGFEIALHYEPLFMLLSKEDPLHVLSRDKNVLEAILGAPIVGLISHAPKLSPLLKNIKKSTLEKMGFLYDGADSIFTMENAYISDANRRWRNGCACRHIGHQSRITLLIHPVWWRDIDQNQRYAAIELLRQGR